MKKFLLITFIFIFLILSKAINSTTWIIDQSGGGNFTFIQEGIDAAANSDTVLVYPGTYYENLNMTGKNITLASLEMTTGSPQYIASTIIDGQRQASCIILHNIDIGVTIRGFTIQNGYGTFLSAHDGGGIQIQCVENGVIMNCHFQYNLAEQGGAIFADLTTLTLSGLRINENHAGYGGAGYWDYGSILTFDPVNRCDVYNNNASKGADFFAKNTDNIHVVVDTFSVFNPDRFFAEYFMGSSYTFDIQHNWMELVTQDLYVSPDGDDNNSGLTPDEPLRNISWAVRKIQADSLNPLTVHVAAGTYSWAENQQIYSIGCKEYVSIIGEDMETTILNNDSPLRTLDGWQLSGPAIISNFTFLRGTDDFTSGIMSLRHIEFLEIFNITIRDVTNTMFIFSTEFVDNNFDNIIIKNNIAERNAGMNLAENTGIMKNCLLENNSMIQAPPYTWISSLILDAYDHFIIENTIISNSNTYDDESYIVGISTDYGENANVTMNNCLIKENNSNSNRIIHFGGDGDINVNNSTIVGNNSNLSTINANSNITLKNTIMHNNTDYEIYMVDDTQFGYVYELNIDNCNIKNGLAGIYNQNNANIINWGEGNIDEDPLFLLSGDTLYQLTELSPCIDTGTPDTTGLYLPPWDLLHNHRVWDGDNNGVAIIDMGCYEYDAEPYVEVTQNQIPNTQYQLYNYPNPFNPETRIVFNLPEEGNVKLIIYNIKGQKVKTMLDCYMSPGRSEMIWNGKDDNGKAVGSGVYFYKLQTPSKSYVRKCMLLK